MLIIKMAALSGLHSGPSLAQTMYIIWIAANAFLWIFFNIALYGFYLMGQKYQKPALRVAVIFFMLAAMAFGSSFIFRSIFLNSNTITVGALASVFIIAGALFSVATLVLKQFSGLTRFCAISGVLGLITLGAALATAMPMLMAAVVILETAMMVPAVTILFRASKV